MKILYIGSNDGLAKAVIESLTKVEYDVYFISKSDFGRKERAELKYRYYALSDKIDVNSRIFLSIEPQIVIYAGTNYTKNKWTMNEQMTSPEGSYLSQLGLWLNICASYEKLRFVYLSSTEVYPENGTEITELADENPLTVKGTVVAQGEYLVQLYQKVHNLQVSILRCSELFELKFSSSGRYFYNDMLEDIVRNPKMQLVDKLMQPVSMNDVADAIKRLIQTGINATYNVCSSNSILKSEIYKLLAEKIHYSIHFTISNQDNSAVYSNKKVKKELEWTDFHSFDNQLKGMEIVISQEQNKNVKNTRKDHPFVKHVRTTFENLFLFALATLLYYTCKDNQMFSGIDWMTVYVVIISLFIGGYHSTLAIALSSIVHLTFENINLIRMDNFYNNTGSILKIIEYIFFGISISYMSGIWKEEIRTKSIENAQLEEEKNELKEINRENILIKNEYEKRLLSTKESLPKLYSVIQKISVLEPARISMEVLHVVADIMNTNTVSVYLTNSQSSYVRLVASLNEESVYVGKSWNLSEYKEIKDAMQQGDIYLGDRFHDEPAMIAPILNHSECYAIIVIKDMDLETQSLYQVNLLRTLIILISDSVKKAMDYEKMVEEKRYYKDTGLLCYEEFKKMVLLAEEKKQKNMADYCIVRIDSEGDLREEYQKIQNKFRNIDILGLNRDGEICVLLGNNSVEEGKLVLERMSKMNIGASILFNFT